MLLVQSRGPIIRRAPLRPFRFKIVHKATAAVTLRREIDSDLTSNLRLLRQRAQAPSFFSYSESPAICVKTILRAKVPIGPENSLL